MIRLRLITLIAVAVVAGAFSAAVTTISAMWTFVALAVLGIAYVAQTRHPRRNLIRLAIALALFWPSFTMVRKDLLSSAPDQLQAITTLIAGTVRTAPLVQSSGSTMFEVSAVMADETALLHPVIIRVQLPDRRAGPTFGQYVRVTGKTSAPLPALNPGEERPGPPSSQLFLASDFRTVFSRSLASMWGRWTARARDTIERRARSLMTYRAFGLLDELLLHRRLFSPLERQLFSATGTSHLLAISGLHLALVFAMMTILLGGIFAASSIGRMLAPLLATLAYLAFIDFPLSADRAFVMLCILALTRLAGGHVSKLAALSWAGLVLTLIDPTSVFDIGLQLSFASVAGLFFIGEPLSRHIHVRKGPLRTLLASLCSTVGASLPAGALAIPTFHTLTPVALVANVVAIPAVSLLLPVLFVWSALLLILPPLAALFAPVINLATAIFFGCLEVLSRLPWSHVNIAVPAPAVFLSLGILFAVVVLVVDNRTRFKSSHRVAIPVIAALTLVVTTFIVTVSPSDTRVTFPVVEKGAVVLVRDRDAGTWLCLSDTDAKSTQRATRAVAALGVNTVDAVIFSGEPLDLPEQLDTLFACLSPRHVWIPSGCVTNPVPGLDDRFQETIQLLGPNQAVGLSRGSSIIKASIGGSSVPILSMTAGALTGTAASFVSNHISAPGFAYDVQSGTVDIATSVAPSHIALAQSGCITVFMRGSRCWVAPDLRH
ncbi:MAG: ComEC/Rec2 family competence protein [Candidatus Cryosericum sp.]